MAKKKTEEKKNGAEGAAVPAVGGEKRRRSPADETRVIPLPVATMTNIRDKVNIEFNRFSNLSEQNLTVVQRRRKIGAGIRNYGFIEKVSDLAAANEDYANFFDPVDLRNAIDNIDLCRDLLLSLQAFVRAVSNALLVYSDEAFTMSLIFYDAVRAMSRRGDPTAMELFRALSPFFRRQRRATEEPTVKELERDVHALLHGTKDGEIVIRNESPKVKSGVREVIDTAHSGRGAAKASVEGESST